MNSFRKKVVRRVGFQMKDVFGFKFEDRLTQLAVSIACCNEEPFSFVLLLTSPCIMMVNCHLCIDGYNKAKKKMNKNVLKTNEMDIDKKHFYELFQRAII